MGLLASPWPRLPSTVAKCRLKFLYSARRRANPDGYTFIPRRVLPRLKELGASDQDIHQLMVENPRRFFEGN
jgi:predicted metal-dependent phosphotriesterase family hydrolase